MPPVLFQGLSWVSIDHAASWALRYTCFVPWRCPWQNSAKYNTIFCTPQKSAKRLEQKRSSDTAPPLVTRGDYVVVWCRTNRSIRVPPLQPYENDNFDLAITRPWPNLLFFYPFCFSFLLKFSTYFAFHCTHFAFNYTHFASHDEVMLHKFAVPIPSAILVDLSSCCSHQQ